MLNPAMNKLLDKVPNRYMLVNVAAKRARVISQDAENQGDYLEDKPVTMALRQIADGKVNVVMEEEDKD
ncbi:MAG: DNA-directed RNA polymerase subunit omega [Ruminococcaceae bacterium]|nr:DNA-directed RNA polymerase subunit omega [Oscillospiraceae bacterium]